MLQEEGMEEDQKDSRPATVMSTLKSGREVTPRKDGERINSASPVRTGREIRKNSKAGSDIASAKA